MTEIHVKVEPDTEEFRIEPGHIYRAKLTEKAENGRANQELIQKMSQILETDVGLVKGHKSRRKKLKTDLNKDEIKEKVEKWEKQR